MTRCVVTGGSGFIGRHLAKVLAERGHEVQVAGRLHPRHWDEEWPAAIGWRQLDLRDDPGHADAILAETDIVFHLGWTSLPTVANRDAAADVTDNLATSLVLLQAAVARRNVRFVFVSSGGYVYGRARRTPIAEDHPTEPISPYGLSKLTFERYLALFSAQHGLDYRIVRPSNAFGAGQDLSRVQGVVTTFLDRAIKGIAPEIWGDGSVIRDFIHVTDIARGLAMVGLASAETIGDHRVFNVGSGCGRSLNDVIDAINQIGLPAIPQYHWGRPSDVPSNVLDISLSSRLLGWQPELSFDEALRLTALGLGWDRDGAVPTSPASRARETAPALAAVVAP